jgi:threonine/homoserine/homoserine lactone efflux protein
VQVGPTRLLSPRFGYTVAYRTVDRNHHVKSTLGVFVYDHSRWRNVTPPHLHADGIDDIAFLDSRHGWMVAYDCANVSVYLYRTDDGGRTWQSLGAKAEHSCGSGPTWLSFVDHEHGWMEPVSPNGPVSVLLRTSDGGRTWTPLANLQRNLPCLAPMLSAVGVSSLILASQVAYDALRLGGAAVLVVLGVRSLFGRHDETVEHPDREPQPAAGWRAGLLTSMSNPKLAAFFVALLPQFLRPGAPVLLIALAMAVTIVAFDVIWFSILAFTVEQARKILGLRIQHRLERISGAVMIGFGLKLASETR